MNVVYLVIVACSLVNCIRTGTAQMVPCFAVSLAYLAGLELFYRPNSPEWMQEWYATAIGGYALMRILAIAEAFLLHSNKNFGLRALGLPAFTIGAAAAALMAFHVTARTMVATAIQVRTIINVWMLVFLVAYVVLALITKEWRPCFARRHLLFAFAMQAALVAPIAIVMAGLSGFYQELDFAFYAVKSIILVGWTAFAVPGPPLVHSSPQSQEAES